MSGTRSLLKGVVALLTGNIIAKLASLAAMPIVSRLYAPADFGVFSVFISVLLVMTPLASMRYAHAIPLPRTDRQALDLLLLSIVLLVASTFVISFFLGIFGDWFFLLIGYFSISDYVAILMLSFFGGGAYEIFMQWATRKKQYGLVAKSKVSQGFFGAGAKVFFGILGLSSVGLLFGGLLNQAGGLLLLIKRSGIDFYSVFRGFKLKRVFVVFFKYKAYPIFRLPSQLILMFSMQAPILVLASGQSISIVGQLGMALTTLAIPVTLFGQAVAQVYYGEIAALGVKRSAEAFKLTLYAMVRLALISLIPFFVIFIFGREIFVIFYGGQWDDAGKFAEILSVTLVAQFVSAPLSNAINVYGSQLGYLVINIIRLALVFLVSAAGSIMMLDIYDLLRLYSYVMCFFYVLTSAYILFLVGNKKFASQEGL